MKFLLAIKGLANRITNGILLLLIGAMHTQLVLSADGFGRQFSVFAESWFFRISSGMDELPAVQGKTNFEIFATFWFFYFGVALIPLGFLVHSIEKEKRALPSSFTGSYLLFVLLGCYMVPNSGMTFIMLPQALYMLVKNYMLQKRLRGLMAA